MCRRCGRLARQRGRREPRESRALPPAHPADLQDKKRSALDAMAYRRASGSPRIWIRRCCEDDGDAGSGLARSAADRFPLQPGPLSHVRRVARVDARAKRSFGCRLTSCTTRDSSPSSAISIISCPSCANGSRTSSCSLATNGAHRRDRRVGCALRAPGRRAIRFGMSRAPCRKGALAQRERTGRQPDQLS